MTLKLSQLVSNYYIKLITFSKKICMMYIEMVRQYKSMQAQSNTQVAQLENELRLTKERLGNKKNLFYCYSVYFAIHIFIFLFCF